LAHEAFDLHEAQQNQKQRGVQAEAQQNRKYVRVCKGACRGIVLSAWIPNHIHQGGGSTWALSSPGPTWVLEGDDSTKANCHHHRGFMIQGSRLPILLISVLRFSFDKRDDRQLHTDHTVQSYSQKFPQLHTHRTGKETDTHTVS
jgi:hypothetical protein